MEEKQFKEELFLMSATCEVEEIRLAIWNNVILDFCLKLPLAS